MNHPLRKILALGLSLSVWAVPVTASAAVNKEAIDTMLSRPDNNVATHSRLQEKGRDGQKPFEELDVYPDQSKLPEEVLFRDNNGGYTKDMESCLYEGNIYIRHRDKGESWRACPMPEDLKGNVVAISMDADEIVALDKDNWIYLLEGLYKDSAEWTWSTSWGEVFSLGRGYQLPTGENGKWSLSNIDPKHDLTYLDGDGKVQPVGQAGCTQIFYLDPKDSANILYADPWLPADPSRAMGSPQHSRFKIRSLSSSASCTFVINKYGKMYTRLFDFDIGGSDPVFFHYSWTPVDDSARTAKNWWDHFLNRSTADIRLPAPYWEEQPGIPGEITDKISVDTTDSGMQNRRLKVEGRQNGKTGYWTKMLQDKTWTFVETGEPLQGKLLRNTGADDLKPATNINYKGKAGKAEIEVKDFAYNDSRTEITIRKDGKEIPAMLYYEYGSYGTATSQIITHRDHGLNKEPRRYTAAIYVDEEGQKALGLKQEINPIAMSATTEKLILGSDTLNRVR